MKSQTIKLLIFAIITLNSTLGNAQLNYSIHVGYGYGNLKEIDKESTVGVSNNYTKLPSYSLGFGIQIPIVKSKFQIVSGIDFISLAAKNNMPDDFNDPNYTGPKSWDERFYSLAIPLKLGYKFEKWFCIQSGFSNTIHLNEPEYMTKKINHYTIGFTGEVFFLVKEKFFVGICYYRDLIPTAELLRLPSKTETYNIDYRFEQFSIKLGTLLK